MTRIGTTPRRRAPIAALVAALTVLGGTGCGDSDAGPAEPEATATTTTTTASTTTAAATPAVTPAAQAYVDAVNSEDLDALVSAFAPAGVVIDVSRRIEGREAIRAWAAREVIGGTLRVDGVTATDEGAQRLRVHWAPAGSDGWAADYTFSTQAGKVTVADLQYAR